MYLRSPYILLSQPQAGQLHQQQQQQQQQQQLQQHQVVAVRTSITLKYFQYYCIHDQYNISNHR